LIIAGENANSHASRVIAAQKNGFFARYAFNLCAVCVKPYFHPMATHHSELKWIDELKFDALQNGKTIRIDANPDENASTGVRPKALILSSLAGCTAIDVVEMLKKMRVEFSDFSIKVSGELTEEHPTTYHTITLTYIVKLKNATDKDKMEKAVNLSQEKYCGVTAMVKKFAGLKVGIEYL
jgi:putative redox protein